MSFYFPVLHDFVLKIGTFTRRNEANQFVDIVIEVENTATGAVLRFLSWETAVHHDSPTEDYWFDVDENSNHKFTDEGCRLRDLSEEPVCSASDYLEDSTKEQPQLGQKVQEIKQLITSDVFNLQSNMTVYGKNILCFVLYSGNFF